MKKILIFATVLIIIYIGAFFLPERINNYSLDPGKIKEVWRFITYQFIHLNFQHLIENIIGLGLIAFIGYELKTKYTDFTTTYMTSGALSVIPIWIIMSFTALGASNAIFGAFGLISQEIKKYDINKIMVIVVLMGLTFMKTISTYLTKGPVMPALKQGLAHFSGLIFGIGAFYGIKKIKPILTKRKRHMLRRGNS